MAVPGNESSIYVDFLEISAASSAISPRRKLLYKTFQGRSDKPTGFLIVYGFHASTFNQV